MHVPGGAATGRTVSRSVPMPGGAAVLRGAGGVAALEAAAAAVLRAQLPRLYCLTLRASMGKVRSYHPLRLGSAPAQLLHLLSARLAAPGGSVLPE